MRVDSLGVESKVIRVLSDCLSVDCRDIESDTRLVEDLFVDSMSLVEIVIIINKVFDVELPSEGVAAWKTVRDICLLLECGRVES